MPRLRAKKSGSIAPAPSAWISRITVLFESRVPVGNGRPEAELWLVEAAFRLGVETAEFARRTGVDQSLL